MKQQENTQVEVEVEIDIELSDLFEVAHRS